MKNLQFAQKSSLKTKKSVATEEMRTTKKKLSTLHKDNRKDASRVSYLLA
jgi:hypothetical protein